MAVAEDKPAAKSSHVSDPALAPFLPSHFDPAAYLNATLPALSLGGRPARGISASLADLSSQTQDLLSQLNAQTTRLSAVLTQLTDDILRSGGRLAYEVEVLRGETTSLTDVLKDGLNDDITKFLPGGLSTDSNDDEKASSRRPSETQRSHGTAATETLQDAPLPPPSSTAAAAAAAADTTPDYIISLRTLTTVRARLETVIKVFGEAMHWTIPPSDVSLGSSLISVSAPEPGSDNASLEQRGKEFAAALRSEIADLITGDPEQGPAKADARIQALRDLALVWKGTAEEKARGKFVEGLVKVAEEKQREAQKEKERSRGRPQRSGSGSIKEQQGPAKEQGRGGFLENLSRIRGFVE